MNICHQDISQILHALQFAALKHQNQRRKNEEAHPYINHLIRVADLLWNIGEISDIPTLIAGILHDTLEDTDTLPEELETTFGTQICQVVQEVTDDKRLPKQERKRLQIEHAGQSSPEARRVKLADKIANLQDIIAAPPVNWSRQRQIEYVDWAEAVINQLRGTNASLEAYFDDTCRQARQILGEV